MHDNVNIVNTEQKLLFDIRELLIEQNKILKYMTVIRPVDVVEIVKEEITLPIKNNGVRGRK
jgi:hypothetical protein